MRSPEEFERIRLANRMDLGLAGTPLGVSGISDGIIGTVLGAAGPIRVASAFPSFATEWDPNQPSQPATPEGSGLGLWFTRSVIRPEITWGGLRVAPGDGYYDASWIARILGWILGIGAAIGGAWVLYRAFGPRQRRSNRSRYFVVGRRAA